MVFEPPNRITLECLVAILELKFEMVQIIKLFMNMAMKFIYGGPTLCIYHRFFEWWEEGGDHLHFTSTSKLCFALSVILHHILRLKSYSQLYESADISKPQLNANGNVNVTNYGLLKVVAAIERPVVNRNDK